MKLIELFTEHLVDCLYDKYVESFTVSYTNIFKFSTCKHVQYPTLVTLP
jgi:hypothetical protein